LRARLGSCHPFRAAGPIRRALDVILDFHSDHGADAASDYWVPRHFRDLSAPLVRQNRVIVMRAIMLWTQGEAAVLVVLYSINVHLLAH
jgi:hypothetical protein